MNSKNHRSRLSVRLWHSELENRVVPATFNIAAGDVAGLRSAITASNTNADLTNTINLASGSTYNIATVADTAAGGVGLPTIVGTTAGKTMTINGNNAIVQRDAGGSTPAFRVFRVLGGTSANGQDLTVVFNNLTIQNGLLSGTSDYGAGVSVEEKASVTLNGCTIRNCQSYYNAAGLGVGTTDSSGFATYSADVTLNDSTIQNNRSTNGGGGGIGYAGRLLSVNRSAIVQNEATNGYGGGIYFSGYVQLTNVTIDGNTAKFGGGIADAYSSTNVPALWIKSSTVYGNTALQSGSSGGGMNIQCSMVQMSHTIVAKNLNGTGGSSDIQAFDPVISTRNYVSSLTSDFNFVGNGSGSALTNGANGNIVGTAASPLDPLLGPLQLNGGSAVSRMPQRTGPVSPVINAGAQQSTLVTPRFHPVRLGTNAITRLQNLQGAASQFPEGNVISTVVDTTNLPVPFRILRGGNNAWSAASATGANPRILNMAPVIPSVTRVHVLINTLWGQANTQAAGVRLIFNNTTTYDVPLTGDVNIRDYLYNTFTNNLSSPNPSVIQTNTVWRSTPVNTFQNTVRLDRQTIEVPAQYQNQTLTNVQFFDYGADGVQRLLVTGATLEQAPTFASTDQAGNPRVAGGRADIGAIETPTAQVAGNQINGGQPSRSSLTTVAVRFNEVLTFGGSVASAFQLVRNGTGGGAVGGFTATANVVNGVTVVTLGNFTGAQTRYGSLLDGRYTLTVLANQVSTSVGPLDGNGDGITGDNYVLSGNNSNGLFSYYGDVDGNGAVDGDDLAGFVNCLFNPPAYNAAFDYNFDGTIDGDDLAYFVQNLFVPLPG